jgi:methylmalonyl-CoA mutase cobalamin-binding subunit
MTHVKAALINQTFVESATGLSREVLRKWELRFGFPAPARNARGWRLYTAKEVERLQLIRRLLDKGMRAGNVVPLPLKSLQDLLAIQCQDARDGQADESALSLLACLAPGVLPHAAQGYLEHLVKKVSLALFVEQYLPVFNLAVGEAWVCGALGIHAEHHYTESVRNVMLRPLAGRPPSQAQPRVLLTTQPDELHSLGALALQVALTLRGADCVSLGTQVPVPDVVQAARSFGTKIVGISVSISMAPQTSRSYIEDLRRTLPTDCRLWVGGKGSESLAAHGSPGVEFFQSTGQAVEVWSQLAKVDSLEAQ